MKKLLSILGSLTLAASASSAVLACSANANHSTTVDGVSTDVVAASLEKAKSIILNNEHGFSQSFISDQQKAIKVSAQDYQQQGIKNANAKSLGKDYNSVNDLVRSYYSTGGVIDNTNTGIDLGGETGKTNTFDALINKVLSFFPDLNNRIVRSILISGKEGILNFIANNEDYVNAKNFDILNRILYDNPDKEGTDAINQTIQNGLDYVAKQVNSEGDKPAFWSSVASLIISIVNGKDKFSNTTIPGFFSGDTMNMVKKVVAELLGDGTTSSPIQNAVYDNADIKLENFAEGESSPVSLLDDYLKPFDAISPKFSSDDKIESIYFKDIKAELLSSAYRILVTVLNPDAVKILTADIPDDVAKEEKPSASIPNYPHKEFVKKLGDLITGFSINAIDKKIDSKAGTIKDEKGNEVKLITKVAQSEKSIMGYIWEILRDITLLNAQFNAYEQTNTVDGSQKVDSQHLFGDTYDNQKLKDSSNYGFINNLVDLKLSETDFLRIKDKPINLNYFFTNLNYYIGDVESGNDDAIYRMQKFLFILFNDPTKSGRSDGTTRPNVWTDKQSDLLDLALNNGLRIAEYYVSEKAKDEGDKGGTFTTINNVLKTLEWKDIKSIKNHVLKPIILGLINGDNLNNILESVLWGLEQPQIKQLIAPLGALGIDLDELYKSLYDAILKNNLGNDTIHKLFVGDYESLMKPFEKVIPQNWIDQLFGTNKINLTTICELPLHSILSMAGISGFKEGMIAPYADYFTAQSIPELAKTLNSFFNGLDKVSGIPDKYISYMDDGVTPNYRESLKIRDIDFNALHDLVISIIGEKPDGSDNVFTTLLNDLINTTAGSASVDKTTKVVSNFGDVKVTVDSGKLAYDLGLKNKSGDNLVIDKKSLAGTAYRLSMPLIDKDNNSGTQFTMDNKYLLVDLLGTDYKQFSQLLNWLNHPGNYAELVKNILINDKAFNINIYDESLTYFKEKRNVIKGFEFKVSYRNYIGGVNDDYVFTVEKNDPIETFQVVRVTTDKR